MELISSKNAFATSFYVTLTSLSIFNKQDIQYDLCQDGPAYSIIQTGLNFPISTYNRKSGIVVK